MFCAEGSLPLPWSIRMKIALGAAQGLAFLHEEADRPVIYRDFKTSNILLDAVCGLIYACIGNYFTNHFLFSVPLNSDTRQYCFRTTIPNFLILDLPRMLLMEAKLMCLPELWEPMAMLPQNM